MILLAGFSFTIYAKGSDEVLFYEDFEDYPVGLSVYNRFTQVFFRDGIAGLLVTKAYRFTYFNANYGNFEQYNFTNMAVKAKIENYNNAPVRNLKGSIGWGFHNNYISSYDYECVWFIYQQGSPLYPWNGFWVWSRNSTGDFSTKKIEGYDVFDWHVYDITLTEDGYDFYIDGEHVAQLTEGVTQHGMGLEIWNDNAVWYPPGRNLSKYTIFTKLSTLFSYIRPFNLPSRFTWGLIPVFHKVRASKGLYIDYVKITE